METPKQQLLQMSAHQYGLSYTLIISPENTYFFFVCDNFILFVVGGQGIYFYE